MIDNIVLFKFNTTYMMICVYENKSVLLIDYESGKILNEFDFVNDVFAKVKEVRTA
jgi:hypothetical protein